MPYSDDRFDDKLKKLVEVSTDTEYFDIGIGAGKFGKMVREIKGNSVNLTGVEIDNEYIEKFGLKNIYNEVFQDNVINFIDSKPNFSTEFVFIGDCIEHLRKSDGIDLINYLIYRCRQIVVAYPRKYIQYAWQGHESEAHKSIWGESDFKDFDYTYEEKDFMTFVTIKGYLNDPEAQRCPE